MKAAIEGLKRILLILLYWYFSMNDILIYSKVSGWAYFMQWKSLAYFDDAEEGIMPYMLTDITWENIKQQILSNIFDNN